jgi:hypothetical protein
VLKIGPIIVEDLCILRKRGDKRHINTAELVAILKALSLIAHYRLALGKTDAQVIKVMCDNQSAIAWLKNADARNWKVIKGLSAKVVEKTLHDISDTCQSMNIKLQLEHVPSESNLADALTRVPSKSWIEPPPEFDTSILKNVICTIPPPQSPVIPRDVAIERDQYNRVVLNSREALLSVMDKIHEHEGAESLYHRLRSFISFPALRKEAQEYVRRCLTCQMSRVTQHEVVSTTDEHMPQATVPFAMVHLDILGPFGAIEGMDQLFVLTFIDRYSRFALTRSTFNCPTSSDVTVLLRLMFERFHVTPDVVVTDQGTQFTASETSQAFQRYNCSHTMTPIRASWANGRVERLHRVINERLRACLKDNIDCLPFTQFNDIIRRATVAYNTSVNHRTLVSPHNLVFTYDAWIHPALKHLRPLAEPAIHVPDVPIPPEVAAKLPAVGQIWLFRLHKPKKYQRPYAVCAIVGRKSRHLYRIRMRNKSVRTVHLRHLKPLTEEALRELPQQLAIPPEQRPLRELRGRGRVAGTTE